MSLPALQVGVPLALECGQDDAALEMALADEAVQRSLAGPAGIKVIARLPKMLSLVPAAG